MATISDERRSILSKVHKVFRIKINVLLTLITFSASEVSFGELLILMAIHFHSNQFTNISDLVCTTLGMKILMRQNNTSKMKQIFIQEIFTEQVVAAHAAKVPVTQNLNANIHGYLPIHCIHQLLKSRAFSKHKVVIKNWIYNQICNCTTPVHPVMPALIEVFVNSIILSNSKFATEQPLSEEEIKTIFQKSEIVRNKINFIFIIFTY